MAHEVVVGVDEEDPVEARRLVDVTDLVAVRTGQADAVERVLRHGQVLELVSVGPVELQADVELLNGAVLDLDVVEAALVVDSVRRRIADAVDGVAAEVELDVASTDHETVARTVEQIVLDVGVVRDHLAARDVRGERRAHAKRRERNDRRRENTKANQQPQPTARTNHLPFPLWNRSDASGTRTLMPSRFRAWWFTKTRSACIQTEMTRNSAKLALELTCRLHGLSSRRARVRQPRRRQRAHARGDLGCAR